MNGAHLATETYRLGISKNYQEIFFFPSFLTETLEEMFFLSKKSLSQTFESRVFIENG